MSRHQEYFDALDRLKKGEPNIVPKGSKINKRNVALEAGKKNMSSIRKGRGFEGLIAAIESAANTNVQKSRAKAGKAESLAARNQQLQDMLDISHTKYLAAMNLLLENGIFSVEPNPAQIIELNEKDNAIRPLIDDQE